MGRIVAGVHITESWARFSLCEKYRYRLYRGWDRTRPTLVWVMLNPSTADAKIDDPTIRRCIGLAHLQGYGSIDVVNLFALRATDPKDLMKKAYLEGADNDGHIERAVQDTDCVVAWGAHGDKYKRRVEAVLKIVKVHATTICCLGKTKTGQPRHPGRVRNNVEWEEWS